MSSKCDFATTSRTEHSRDTTTGCSLWPVRLVKEVAHRFHLAFRAPTIGQSIRNERERRYAERQRLAEEYAQGYLEGWHECYSTCLDVVEESVSDRGDIWAAGDLLSNSQDASKAN